MARVKQFHRLTSKTLRSFKSSSVIVSFVGISRSQFAAAGLFYCCLSEGFFTKPLDGPFLNIVVKSMSTLSSWAGRSLVLSVVDKAVGLFLTSSVRPSIYDFRTSVASIFQIIIVQDQRTAFDKTKSRRSAPLLSLRALFICVSPGPNF